MKAVNPTSRKLFALAVATSALAGVAIASDAIAPVTDALQRPALQAKAPQRAMLLAAANAGKRIVAVGERGLILLSDDDGANWKQSAAPVSVSLTGVRFADANNGVAIGHAGVVLLTHDAGNTWQLALDGKRAAQLALDAENALPDSDEKKTNAVADAQRLVDDGADKPLLDVLVDGPRIVVVGAYGLIFASEDGGKTWASWMSHLDNSRGLYLYALRKRGNTLLIAGEQGFLARSDDNGATFKKLESPYAGSWFTEEFVGGNGIVLAGLRGNAFASQDDGKTWKSLDGALGASLTSSFKTADGRLLLSTQSGQILRVEGEALKSVSAAALPPINSVFVDGTHVLALTVQGIVAVDAAKETK